MSDRTEQRQHRRSQISLPILVRSQNGQEELSTTDDASKAGVALRLVMPLPVGAVVTIICPYAKGAMDNIEQRAEIRHRSTLPFDGKFRYGLRYIR
jgi:hypothetical protein